MYGEHLYGTRAYSETSPTEVDIEPFTPDLMSYLPPFYQKIITMKKLQDSKSKEIGYLKFSLDDLLNQSFIETATWGLSRWEEVLGLEKNFSKSDEFRREIIKAKLRGRGTTTKALIKRTAESFTNTEVEVIEKNEEYYFIIKFIGMKGIPQNMAGLIEEIEIIKPAHLLYGFEYTYTWWDTLRYEKPITWGEAAKFTWDELRVY